MLRDAVRVPPVCLMHGHGPRAWTPELPMSPRVCAGFGTKVSVSVQVLRLACLDFLNLIKLTKELDIICRVTR